LITNRAVRIVPGAGILGILFLLLTAVPALACLDPNISLSGSSFSAGDPVGYSISNTLPGAHYTIKIGGVTVADSTDPGGEPGLQGTFTMPDLGEGASAPSFEATVDHPEDGYPHQAVPGSGSTMNYRGHASATSTPSPTPQVTSTPSPTGVPTTHSGPAPAPAGNPSPAGGQQAGAGDSLSAPSTTDGSAVPESGTPALGKPAEHHATVTAPGAPDASEPAGSSLGANASAGPVQAGQSSASVRPAGGLASAQRPPAGARPAAKPVPEPAYHPGAALETSSAVVSPGILLLLGLLGGACLYLVLRRNRPGSEESVARVSPWTPPSVQTEVDWRSALIEAELQEIIAEDRARRLIPDREPSGSDQDLLVASQR